VWLPGWGLRRRWAFHDGVRVAELLVRDPDQLLGLKAGDDPKDDKLLAALKARFKEGPAALQGRRQDRVSNRA